jgi:acetolactate decarboxylase
MFRRSTLALCASLSHPARRFLLLFSLALALVGCGAAFQSTPTTPERDYTTLTQISTYGALQAGGFDGDTTFAEVAQYGDFGLGTFDHLEGEMIALDGVFYRGLVDGSVQIVEPSVETPFANIHFFQTDRQINATVPISDMQHLTTYLSAQLPSLNRPYGFRISGLFSTLKYRSVARQSQPYPTLQEAIAGQLVFEVQNIRGTLVGYYLPEYLSSISLPGYHFHFISEDKQRGGHTLDMSFIEGSIEIDYLENVKLIIPQSDAFQQKNFRKP